MESPKKMIRVCAEGHEYIKSSDCPTCPVCEAERKPEHGFLSKVGAPARRALEREGITTLATLSQYTTGDILRLHGVGPSSIPTLEKALGESGLSFSVE